MIALKLFLTRLNGWALSLALHGGVALIAGLSVFSVHAGGGSGRSGSGGVEGGLVTQSFAATLRNGEDENLLSGTVLPDTEQFTRLTSEDLAQERVAEETPVARVPFDVFAVGSTDVAAATSSPSLADPQDTRPGSAEGRATKLPPGSAPGNGQEGGGDGLGGTGGGASDGNGAGEGSGDGHATGVYTPAPAYPSEARRRNIEGSVLVELAIAADGSCALQRILESSGFSPLDEAVEKTVSHWKYRASEDDGRSDSVTKRIRFTFKLGR